MFIKWLKEMWRVKDGDDSSIKVLIIEDNLVDVKMAKKAVSVCGFSSLVAYDGRSGIEMAKKHNPSLIILDYGLPDINGGQVLKELRKIKETSSEVVMVLTILNTSGVVVDSFLQGADQYFTKSISISLLARQIKFMVGQVHEN